MQWLDTPLQPKGPRFEISFEFCFSSTNKMDESKFPLGNFLI
jgi:hypothetical protein